MRKDIFVPIYKTSIMPLRWVVDNIFHTASMYFFSKGLKMYFKYEDQYDKVVNFVPPKLDRIKTSVYFTLHKIMDMPYSKFGTIYKLDGTPYITDTTSSSSLIGSQWQTSTNSINNINTIHFHICYIW